MRPTLTLLSGVIAAVVLCSCTHTYVSNGGQDKSPGGKRYLYVEIHGASSKAYVDKTKKTVCLSVWPTAGKPEKQDCLFAGKHVFVGGDVGQRVKWVNDDELSIVFYDYGDKVLIGDAVKAGLKSNYIATVKIHRDAVTGKFVEVP